MPFSASSLRALHQHFFGLDEFFSSETKIARMGSGIHANRIARTSFDTVTAINTPQRVDFVANRKFFYRIVRIFSGLDIDAFRRTRRGTEKTSSALHRAVLFQRQPMAATKGIRIRRALFGVLHGDRRLGVASPSQTAAGSESQDSARIDSRSRTDRALSRENRAAPRASFLQFVS